MRLKRRLRPDAYLLKNFRKRLLLSRNVEVPLSAHTGLQLGTVLQFALTITNNIALA